MFGALFQKKGHLRMTCKRHRLLFEALGDRRVLATITGMVFDDANASLRKDAGESGLNERLVYLDLDQSGSFTAADRWARTEGGDFTFENVAAGQYQVRLYDGSSSQQQTTPRTLGAVGEPVAVENLTQTATQGDFLFGFSANSVVRVNLTDGTSKSLGLSAAGTDIAPLPDGKLLILQDDAAEPAVIADFAAETVTEVDLGLTGQETRWASVAVAPSGKGLVLPNDSQGKVRLFSSEPAPAANAATTDTNSAAAVVMGSNGTTAMLWHATENGIQVQQASVETGELVGNPIDLEDVTSLFAFDQGLNRIIGRFSSGNLGLWSIQEGGSIVREFVGF